MFKIGIGPSSSHTLGPMKAAKMFLEALKDSGKLQEASRVTITFYGSLALTGKGHQADQAVLLGLAGEEPESVDIAAMPKFMDGVRKEKKLPLNLGVNFNANAAGAEGKIISFHYDLDLIFEARALPLHENGVTFTAFAGSNELLRKTYYSTGGGVVVAEEDFGSAPADDYAFPYSFSSAAELLGHCSYTGLSISSLVLENECTRLSRDGVQDFCRNIWETMRECMKRGLHTEGLLPGPLRVPRRSANLRRRLVNSGKDYRDPLYMLDWVNMFAMAVAEENAAGGRVVTAPTNGACGIVPAVFAYYRHFIQQDTPLGPDDDEDILRYFLSAGAIGLLFRVNASISGAEVGCQGEIGVACSMAAAGLAELLGASPTQVCTAAEIGMEHNLGLTCDPVGGQVQIPCIERNAINAVKAINAARMALERRSNPMVSLDTIIAAMYNTGKDMSPKYRETAQGGLAAVPIIGCC